MGYDFASDERYQTDHKAGVGATMLWLLKRTNDRPKYDVNNGFVIRAQSENDARFMASKECADEGAETWTDPAKSTCEPLWQDGDAGVILTDFNAG